MNAMAWTTANAVMLLLFAFSAILQFNDPDALVWIAIYAAAAVASGLELRRSAPVWLPIMLALIAIVWALSLAPRAHDVPIGALFAEWEMKDLHVEEAREMYGLTIVAVWMIAIATASWLRAKRGATGRA
jgi:transmembrane protein TMEM220